MVSGLLAAIVPLVAIVLGVAIAWALVYYWREKSRSHDRQSPLCRDLLRPPGHSLRLKLRGIDFEIDASISGMLLVPLMVYAIHISQSHFGGVPESIWRVGFSLVLVLVAEILIGKQLLRLLKERRGFALGLDGELATAEELNQLMLDGCRVFHDVPIKYGNVDHVVVSHSGVYAVNTKALAKPKNGGNADVVVDHTKKVIRFPDRTYPIPEEQLITEAKCLSEYLTKALGKSISAEPMLALPGWCVKERIGRGPVCVFNPRHPQKFFLQNRQVLSPEMIQQVAHQLEQLCRNVEPVFQEKHGWA